VSYTVPHRGYETIKFEAGLLSYLTFTLLSVCLLTIRSPPHQEVRIKTVFMALPLQPGPVTPQCFRAKWSLAYNWTQHNHGHALFSVRHPNGVHLKTWPSSISCPSRSKYHWARRTSLPAPKTLTTLLENQNQCSTVSSLCFPDTTDLSNS
jgi:hypothetical protein